MDRVILNVAFLHFLSFLMTIIEINLTRQNLKKILYNKNLAQKEEIPRSICLPTILVIDQRRSKLEFRVPNSIFITI